MNVSEQESSADVAASAARLREAGVRTLTGVVSDTGGVIRSKTAPAARLETFARSGMGASQTWPVFAVDNGIAMHEGMGVVGDLRLVADLGRAVVLPNGAGWAPADVCDQDGQRSPYCWRDVLRRQVDGLAALGIEALMGHEMEFTLCGPDGLALGATDGWPCYGQEVYSRLGAFPAELCEALAAVDIPVEQLHAEYGCGQFEVSLPPRTPVDSADNVLLARTVIGRVARAHGLRASFSPVPFPGFSGNGAHVHVSLVQEDVPLFSGGSGPGGLTGAAGTAIAGLVAHLPESVAVLAGTVVSGERMQPGHWSGAWSAWGVENREAALRLLQARPGNPHGANLEIKCVDGGANPWLSAGLILGLMRHGLQNNLPVPEPVCTDPAGIPATTRQELGIRALPHEPLRRIELFTGSEVVKQILGEPLHRAAVAVREHEVRLYTEDDPHTPTRFAWSA